eukprot:5244669-Pleurochrysis_carterae.AAC.2
MTKSSRSSPAALLVLAVDRRAFTVGPFPLALSCSCLALALARSKGEAPLGDAHLADGRVDLELGEPPPRLGGGPVGSVLPSHLRATDRRQANQPRMNAKHRRPRNKCRAQVGPRGVHTSAGQRSEHTADASRQARAHAQTHARTHARKHARTHARTHTHEDTPARRSAVGSAEPQRLSARRKCRRRRMR